MPASPPLTPHSCIVKKKLNCHKKKKKGFSSIIATKLATKKKKISSKKNHFEQIAVNAGELTQSMIYCTVYYNH